MYSFLDGSGFLGGRGSAGADLTLLVMIAAAVLLTVGVFLARSRRYEAHRWVQTGAVILNLVPVLIWMIRSFWVNVRPALPGDLKSGVTAITTVHAAVGLVGVILGLVVVIRANQLAARGGDLGPWRTPMRIAYVVYLLGTVLGVWAYFRIYG